MDRRTFLASLAAAPLAAQEDPVIKVDVELVSLLCSVRDKRGKFIKTLEKPDFTILEDGKKQDVRNFSRESDLPLTIGLLVDVSGSQRNLIEIERRAAGQFFKQVLREKDMAFLISFGAEAELLQDSTNSVRLLQKGLDGLRVNSGVGGVHPSPTGQQARGTIMFDAVYLAANEKLKREVGRKVIVLITDGVDMGSRISKNEALSEVQKADTIIYSIYYTDPRAYGGWGFGGDGDLKKMSDETGGRVFHASGRNSLDEIFAEIQEEMRSQYNLAYTPSNPNRDGGFRKVEVKLAHKDYKAYARKGYFATAA
ncbi:MAG: VWA domain-containing protein [Acidobacteria bacterium]|nr:VWA domain-containing protein [Acidobacteriota bacterium]